MRTMSRTQRGGVDRASVDDEHEADRAAGPLD
jgi:hypothetical protein